MRRFDPDPRLQFITIFISSSTGSSVQAEFGHHLITTFMSPRQRLSEQRPHQRRLNDLRLNDLRLNDLRLFNCNAISWSLAQSGKTLCTLQSSQCSVANK